MKSVRMPIMGKDNLSWQVHPHTTHKCMTQVNRGIMIHTLMMGVRISIEDIVHDMSVKDMIRTWNENH